MSNYFNPNIPDNPYDSGWRAVLLWIGFFLFFGNIIYWCFVNPKLEICKTYYSELSTMTCLISDYGMPPRSSK